ncbi:transcriptional regulator [Vespertiliibacter pulmonis]|uniref:DeoR family transcriptional regulator n=1 Tax=Vespertiliibacter pulmonis TaxID=1443036 RepID=A0A3N4WKT6_9PAST|nr:HTH-type transcriptional regulator UlaR [Vespertiliibacter pulmonis]QLB21324.1 transcriptional regulator [Vespertiliibacter pulmonis]RPE85734.1 DeoR family transcriptional regulator [Vespertiliibacter pulmonis]
MNENYRHLQLLTALEEKKRLSIQEIIGLLDISPATARRDITKLSEQGKLHKVRNGAEAISLHRVAILPLMKINNIDEKQRIADTAAKLCKDGESVILTCGSTMKMLGSSLCGRDVQIITHFLPLANYLIEQDHNDVVIIGGQYSKNQAITLSMSSHNDSMYAANIMFTSGKGLTTAGLYKTDMLIANSEQRMRSKVSKLVVLLDSSKLGQQAGMLFESLHNIDLLITGKEAEPNIIEQLRSEGLNIILA